MSGEAPIGALGDGFEDRLVLESRGELSRWGGCLFYVLMVPVALLMSFLVSLVFVGGAMVLMPTEFNLWSILFPWSVLLSFVGMLYYFFREYRTRDFHEIAVRDSYLEITGRAGSLELADVKCWPHGLGLLCDDGQRFTVRCASEEKKLQAMERLLPGLVAAQKRILEAGQEVHLHRSWRRLGSMLVQALFAGASLLLLGIFVHPMVGIALGVLAWAWLFFPTVRDFRTPGLILSRTGLRRLGESREFEVGWGEVKGVWANAFFQDTLRVTTRNGIFTLLSARNPIVWAVLIGELSAAATS